jgi:hypothetical protein
MKIIIDIPDEVKEAFDNANIADVDCYVNDYDLLLGKAIKNGTPLPKYDFEEKVLARLGLIHSENLAIIRQLGCDNYLKSHTADCYGEKWASMKAKEREEADKC